jgi:hypothetical protein
VRFDPTVETEIDEIAELGLLRRLGEFGEVDLVVVGTGLGVVEGDVDLR